MRIRKFKGSDFIWKILLVSLLIILVNTLFFANQFSKAIQESRYAVSSRAPFNHFEFYPVKASPSKSLYLPIGQWTGRMILPSDDEILSHDSSDWVWLEVTHATPQYKELLGEKVILTWQDNPAIKAYLKLVTTDIKFSQEAQQALRDGNILPTRLNQRSRVGPLQSLAGARPRDDVTVSLEQVQIDKNQIGQTVLKIATSPLQITGRFYGLVRILNPIAGEEIPTNCPENIPCTGQLYRVVHYNQKLHQFNGVEEIIRIPQQPTLDGNRFNSTPYQVEKSKANRAGWYIYGDLDKNSIFTVQALRPREAFGLSPDRLFAGNKQDLKYIDVENWRDTNEKKGKFEKVFLAPTIGSIESHWHEGDTGLVIHNFGAIGGKKGELGWFSFPTGHFAYGLAKVIREPLANELQFQIEYQQVYAQNPDGIISGKTSWETFLGNLQRGWLDNRPVSDVIVNVNWLVDYLQKEAGINPFKDFLLQSEIMMARYRTGDGTGISAVTPGTSCVQDSTQALYLAIEQIGRQLKIHSTDLSSKRFFSLAESLRKEILPFGIVRPDWQENNNRLSGVNGKEQFLHFEKLWAGLLSWQSMIPRRAADQMSRLFLEHGSSLNYIRTNQVGGWLPDIFPVAPTSINGLPFLSTFLTRLILAFSTKTTDFTWWIMVQFTLLYGIIVVPIGFRSGFLRWSTVQKSFKTKILVIVGSILSPALVEEVFFRVLIIPNIVEIMPLSRWFLLALVSLILFVLYHPLIAITFYKLGRPTFFNPIFLLLTSLLGIICTSVYKLTGSIWPSIFIHWLVVVVWLLFLDGLQKLNSSQNDYSSSRHLRA